MGSTGPRDKDSWQARDEAPPMREGDMWDPRAKIAIIVCVVDAETEFSSPLTSRFSDSSSALPLHIFQNPEPRTTEPRVAFNTHLNPRRLRRRSPQLTAPPQQRLRRTSPQITAPPRQVPQVDGPTANYSTTTAVPQADEPAANCTITAAPQADDHAANISTTMAASQADEPAATTAPPRKAPQADEPAANSTTTAGASGG
ncbi:hypothetical protein cypCar_00015415 [Cyprinus carpio]|nr:hypothetical protein cypCar_00015415 [Cyprinus carpio]